MDVFGIFVVVSFMCIIGTLAVMNIIKKINYSKEYTPKSNVLTNTYDAWKNHNSQELFDTGRMSSVIGSRCEISSVDYSLCQMEANDTQVKYLETVPKHSTRVKLRNSRKLRNKRKGKK